MFGSFLKGQSPAATLAEYAAQSRGGNQAFWAVGQAFLSYLGSPRHRRHQATSFHQGQRPTYLQKGKLLIANYHHDKQARDKEFFLFARWTCGMRDDGWLLGL